jgi:hypothetical protein
MQGDELRALRRLQRESPTSPFVFVSERGSPFTTAGFARMIERAMAAGGLEIKAHPHMQRHACGYARKQGPRHSGHPGLARASVDHQHRGLHGAGAEQVQGLLAGVSGGRRGSPTDLESYWITSSAVASSVSGNMRPSALAVFILSTVRYLVGACTGRSAGFAPLRMRST